MIKKIYRPCGSYEIDEWDSEEVTVDGIIYDVNCHYIGWGSRGNQFDGEDEICELIIESARYEETDDEIELTDEIKNDKELKQKIIDEIYS